MIVPDGAVAVLLSDRLLPAQIGPLLPIAVIAGPWFTVAEVVLVPVATQLVPSVTVSE